MRGQSRRIGWGNTSNFCRDWTGGKHPSRCCSFEGDSSDNEQMAKASRSAGDLSSRRRLTAWILIGCVVIAGCAVGYIKLRHYVVARLTRNPSPVAVVLKNRPIWMTAYLADTITNSVRPDVPGSPFDKKILIDVYNQLAMSPWVKKVNQVRRVYGKAPGDTLEVDCTYHTPAALVEYGNQYTLVAADRTILPEQFSEGDLPKVMFGSDASAGHTQLRIIQGVKNHPTEAGAIWKGNDLAEGLQLAALLAHRSFTDDIVRIDVSNADGRVNSRLPNIILLTKTGSQIRWGHAPNPNDFTEVSAAEKLLHLEQVYQQFHRVDASQPWIDVRFDHVEYPNRQASAAGQTER